MKKKDVTVKDNQTTDDRLREEVLSFKKACIEYPYLVDNGEELITAIKEIMVDKPSGGNHTFGVCKKCGYSLVSKEHIPCTITSSEMVKKPSIEQMEKWINEWDNGVFELLDDSKDLAKFLVEKMK